VEEARLQAHRLCDSERATFLSSLVFRTPRLPPCCSLLSLSLCTVVQPCSPFPFSRSLCTVFFILFKYIYQQWGLPLLYLWLKKKFRQAP
jgi:hypothetical protein